MPDLYAAPIIADGAGSTVAYTMEAVYGQLPASPTFTAMPRTSFTMNTEVAMLMSEEMRRNRGRAFVRQGPESQSGDYAAELAAGKYRDFLKALMGNFWQAASEADIATVFPLGLAFTTVNYTPSSYGNSVEVRMAFDAGELAAFTALGFRHGDIVDIDGTGNVALDGVRFTIISIGSGTISFLGHVPFTTTLSAAAVTAGTITHVGGRLSVGNVVHSMTMERWFQATNTFLSYTGVRVNTAAIDLSPSAIATISFGLVGKDSSLTLYNSSLSNSGGTEYTTAELGTLTFAASNRAITRSGGSTSGFISEGFLAGDLFNYGGASAVPANNRGPYTITQVVSETEIRVAETVESGSSGGNYTWTHVTAPTYSAIPSSTEQPMVAIDGGVFVERFRAGTITALSFNIDNGLSGPAVLGSRTVSNMFFGLHQEVTGSITVLFDLGGPGEFLYEAFRNDQPAVTIIARLDSDTGHNFQVFMEEVVFSSGAIGDAAADGLPITLEFTARVPSVGSTVQAIASPVIISDTAITELGTTVAASSY